MQFYYKLENKTTRLNFQFKLDQFKSKQNFTYCLVWKMELYFSFSPIRRWNDRFLSGHLHPTGKAIFCWICKRILYEVFYDHSRKKLKINHYSEVIVDPGCDRVIVKKLLTKVIKRDPSWCYQISEKFA